MFTLTIPRSHIAAVSRFMASQDVRYYLNGLQVECYANVAYIAATDGHTLALGRIERNNGWEMSGQGSCIIPREFVEKIKPNGNNGMPLVLTVDGESFTLDDCGVKTSGKAIDGQFPDWRRVIPKKCSGEAAFYNPEYLMRCFKAAKDLGSKAGFFGLSHNGQASALVSFDANPDVLAVLMPMRGCEATMPEWHGENPESFGRLELDAAWDEAIAQEAGELLIAA